jgi:hypothetical protein
LEVFSYVATFLAILESVRSILDRLKKEDEARAIDKAVNAIEANPNIKLEEAKETYRQTMIQTLGEERARPVVQYTDVVENFFPFKPQGRVLPYGLAIEQLVLGIHDALYTIDAFKLFGELQNSARTLDFPRTANSLRGQGITHVAVPEGDYSLRAFLFETPQDLEKRSGFKGRYQVGVRDLLVLRAEQHGKTSWIFLSADESSPFSLTFAANGRTSEKKLEYYQFDHLMSAIMSDASQHLDSVAREHEKSKKVSERFAHILEALRRLRVDLGKPRDA